MSSLMDTEEEVRDTEITLNTASLLGIFFGLVLVCGVFFGFGYSMGRRAPDALAARSATADSPEEGTGAVPAAERHRKATVLQAQTPSKDEIAGQSAAAPESSGAEGVTVRTADAASQEAAPDSAVPAPPDLVPAVEARAHQSPETSASRRPIPVKTAAASSAVPVGTTVLSAMTAPASSSMVQIAAVSREEDAEVLVLALRKRGYSVVVRREPQDALTHVQVGPFATRAEANAMRQKLLADGYNAIVKQ